MTKFCPACGEKLVDNARFCKKCGASVTGEPTPPRRPQMPVVEKSYAVHIVVGYAMALLVTLVGLIIGVYLVTRKDSENARKHGTYILIVCFIMWAFSFARILF